MFETILKNVFVYDFFASTYSKDGKDVDYQGLLVKVPGGNRVPQFSIPGQVWDELGLEDAKKQTLFRLKNCDLTLKIGFGTKGAYLQVVGISVSA